MHVIIPLKKWNYVFDPITRFVCLAVITFMARWLHSAIWCEVMSRLSTRPRKCNTSQDDPFPDPEEMDHPDPYHNLANNFESYQWIRTKFYLYVVQLWVHHTCRGF